MNETEHPEQDGDSPRIVDKRASAKRKRDSLYGNDPQEAIDASEKHAVRVAPLRWAPGHDPNDPETDNKGTGWETVKLEVLEHPEPDVDGMRGIHGVPSRVRCFECKRNDYLIIDRLSREQRLEAATPDVKHAVRMNRPLAREITEPIVMLFCPGCKSAVQMLESAMFGLRRDV